MNKPKKNSLLRTKKLKKTAKRLTAYSTAAVATVVATERTTNAAEQVYDIEDITVAANLGSTETNVRGVFFDMVNGTTSSRLGSTKFSQYTQGKFALNPSEGGYIYGPAYNTFASTTTGGAMPHPRGTLGFIGVGTDASAVAESSSVGLGDNFIIGGPYNMVNYYANLFDWDNSETGFAGIRFSLGENTHYGWAQITNIDSVNFTLHGFGYNDASDAASHPIDTFDVFDGISLQVNTDSGVVSLLGHDTENFVINSYQITSDSGSIDPNGWNSLDEQDFAASVAGDFNKDELINSIDLTDPVDGWEARFGANLDGGDFLDWQGNFGSNGTPTGWEEGGAVSEDFLGEVLLVGDSTIAAGASIDLGTIFDEQPGPAGSSEDWVFQYRTADGNIIFRGKVTYVGGLAAASAVPEPSSMLLLALGAAGLGTWRKTKERSS
jgi:hypothetical protein